MFVIVTLLVLALDAVSKQLVQHNMAEGETATFIKGIFDLTFVKNRGAAFGIFYGKQILLTIVVAALIVGICVYVYVCRKKLIRAEKTALALIVSGGIGNLASRTVYGYVTDFFNCYFWPVFNVADIAICVGCGLLLLSVLIIEPKKQHNEQ